MSVEICRDLLSHDLQRHPENIPRRAREIDFGRFGQMGNEKALVMGWFNLSRNRQSPFDAFRDLWQAFNEWAKVVTSQRRDSVWIDVCMLSSHLQELFVQLRDGGSFGEDAKKFQQWWPVFDADKINRERLRWLVTPRDKAIAYYFQHGVPFSPPCWRRHLLANDSDDFLDWPHTLSALYRVRNNLFHGSKSMRKGNSDMVKSAYEVLYRFIYEGGLFE